MPGGGISTRRQRGKHMIDYERARRQMVDTQLRTSSITDRRLLRVMGQVPREQFVPASRRDLAYVDAALPLDCESGRRQLAAPAGFARLVQLAAITEGDKVLDLGCGSGYSTAVLAGLAGSVVSVEPDAKLAAEAEAKISALGITNATVLHGGLFTAARPGGPFDVIVVEGTVGRVPDSLFPQLTQGGRLVVAVQGAGTGVAHLFVKAGPDVTGRSDFDLLLPPLPIPHVPEAFVF